MPFEMTVEMCPAEAESKVRTMFFPLDEVFQWEDIVPSHLQYAEICQGRTKIGTYCMKREVVGYICTLVAVRVGVFML